jgi:multicomponent Na+:H+ antiporter subunit E
VPRVIAIFGWAFLIWALLTWTLSAEQLLFGAGIALAVAVALAPLGEVAGPWRLLTPPRLTAVARLLILAAGRIVAANVRLSLLIWNPRPPLRSGMVVVPTAQRSDGGLTAVGLVTSVIVDNQLVDLDRSRGRLQYHAVEVPAGGPDQAREQINGPVERVLAGFGGPAND